MAPQLKAACVTIVAATPASSRRFDGMPSNDKERLTERQTEKVKQVAPLPGRKGTRSSDVFGFNFQPKAVGICLKSLREHEKGIADSPDPSPASWVDQARRA
jgi:hypothetical protein